MVICSLLHSIMSQTLSILMIDSCLFGYLCGMICSFLDTLPCRFLHRIPYFVMFLSTQMMITHFGTTRLLRAAFVVALATFVALIHTAFAVALASFVALILHPAVFRSAAISG